MIKRDWRVIVVEDNYDDLQVILTVFEYYGIEAHGVSSARECGDLLRNLHPQAVVTDLAMPNADGWDILALVREHDPKHDIAVAAMTSYHSDKLAEKVYQRGFDEYFPKPIDPHEFIVRLEAMVQK
ncbi:MAG: response regulator [Chloroflexi bacterium]|nr:response regulator [Chloroflexota bacterium]MCC6895506.1 response regulator [Anaerolineae bacterium]